MNEKIDSLGGCKLSLPDNVLKNIKIPDLNMSFNCIQQQDELINMTYRLNKEKQQKEIASTEREIENNNTLKNIEVYNKKITEYNKDLVSLNAAILKRIDSTKISLEFILESIKENSDINKDNGTKNNALLLELITIMDSKDSEKIKKFFGGLTGNVGAGLIVELIKVKSGMF